MLRKRWRGASLLWYIKQLLPLHYCTVYQPVLERNESEMRLGPYEYVRWRMWLGRCFRVHRSTLA